MKESSYFYYKNFSYGRIGNSRAVKLLLREHEEVGDVRDEQVLMDLTSGTAQVKQAEKERWRPYNAVKRLLDLLLAAVGLVILSPLFLITAVAVRLDSKGPAFYSQERIGKKGKPFKMYKFRSMCVDADQQLEKLAALNERDGPAFKIANDPRVTRVGRVIRKTCIDELPQLLNILKGDMSLVGPRPPLPNEVATYTPYQMRRLDVTPGLTCYWQVRKGEDTTFEEWVEMDLQYIRDRSLKTDLKLLFATVRVVVLGKGSM